MRGQSGGCPGEGPEGAEGLLGAGRTVLLGPLLASLVGSLCERPPSRSPTVCDLAVVPQALLDPVSASAFLTGQALTHQVWTRPIIQMSKLRPREACAPEPPAGQGQIRSAHQTVPPPPVPFPRHITPTSAVMLTRLGLAVLQCRVSPAPG